MSDAINQCATSFGRICDFYIERPRISRTIGRVIWGVDLRPMYSRIEDIGEINDGAVVADAGFDDIVVTGSGFANFTAVRA